MAFEKFTQTGRSFAPKASISTYGTLSFNNGARKRYQMDEYTHCILYYDRDTHRVGIEMTCDRNIKGSRTLRHRKTGCDVSAKPFVDYFNIHIAGTTYYDLDRDEQTGLLVFDILKGVMRKRKTKRAE